MQTRRFKFSIRTILALTLVVGVIIVAWQYIRRPPPPESAWEAYLLAVTTLQDTGNRKLAAKQFADVERLFPDSVYKDDSLEMATLLQQMIGEDRVWREPRSPDQLPLPERIKYHIYHFRDVTCYQEFQPGMCHLLTSFGFNDNDYNAAVEIHKLGEPAIPHLIGLLNDRRPIRSVGYWRHSHPSRTVLRYQDAAIQILNELLPQSAYDRKSISAYFSTESKQTRVDVTQQIGLWWNRRTAE